MKIRQVDKPEIDEVYSRLLADADKCVDPDLSILGTDRLRKDTEWYVGYIGTEPVALVALAFDVPTGATLDTVYVARDSRGNGIGRKMTIRAIKAFVDRKETTIYCDAGNEMLALLLSMPADVCRYDREKRHIIPAGARA